MVNVPYAGFKLFFGGETMRFQDYKNYINDIEGVQFPSNSYRHIVLQPAYNEARKHFLTSMIQIHIAHLKMLEEQHLIAKDDVKQIAKAINDLDLDYFENQDYNPQFEDLFFRIEHKLIELTGDVAGNLHIARSRNDMGIAIYRMTLRKKLLKLMEELLTLRTSLILFAEENIETIMLGYTHTQQAQPTTLAHYFKGVIDQLTRDFKRMQAAYLTINQSSMGAAALTTTGFMINRDRMKELLGFDEVIENAWDAVAGADYLGEAAIVIQLAALNLGRISQDLLQWATQEFNTFRLASPYVQVSSIMPQKRNPVAIEHTRSLLSSVLGDASTVLQMMHNTPFGDIVDTEDDMQPYLWRAISNLQGVYKLFGSYIVTMEINKEQLLQRAKMSFANVTELADSLVRAESISFRKSHQLIHHCIHTILLKKKDSLDALTWELVNEKAIELFGKPLTISQEKFYAALDPAFFINIRTIKGGPAPETMRQALQQAHKLNSELCSWVNEKNSQIHKSEEELRQIIKGWNAE